VEYAETLYKTDYPRPSHLLREAARVAKPGGRIGFVHFLVPLPPEGWYLEDCWGITQGCGYRIRALSIFRRREGPGLFG
jgi:ubiquinone/menaquinone biosynthesis C-methylase UbiE